MAEFPSGKRQEQPAGVKKELACPKCARTFNYEINLANHVKWHDSSVKDKVFLTPPPPPRPQHEIELMLAPLSSSTINVCILIDGLTCAEISAAREADKVSAEKEKYERGQKLAAEAAHRVRRREAAAEVELEEGRRGSNRRGRYTAKFKLVVLEVFDAINADSSNHQKVQTFEADPRVKSTPYTTVRNCARTLGLARGSCSYRSGGRQRIRFITSAHRSGTRCTQEGQVHRD